MSGHYVPDSNIFRTTILQPPTNCLLSELSVLAPFCCPMKCKHFHAGMVLESLPPWLKTHCTKLEKEGLFSGSHINHVLVNEYTPGQGIMPHVDGPLFTPLIATLNLGSSCLLKFQTRDSDTDHLKDEFSLFLEEGSVLVQTGEVYERFLHGIEEVEEDLVSEDVANLGLCHGVCLGDVVKRGTRVSLTIRSVPKVVKFKLRL